MRASRHFAFATTAVVLLAGLVFGRPGMAQESTGQVAGSWTVRGFGAWLHPSGDPYPSARRSRIHRWTTSGSFRGSPSTTGPA